MSWNVPEKEPQTDSLLHCIFLGLLYIIALPYKQTEEKEEKDVSKDTSLPFVSWSINND